MINKYILPKNMMMVTTKTTITCNIFIIESNKERNDLNRI